MKQPAIAFALACACIVAPAVANADDAASVCPPATVQMTPELLRENMKNARDHGFLWRIGKDGRTSYLYGTLHVARIEWVVPGPSIIGALRASDTIALELDVLDPDIRQRLAVASAANGATRGEALPPALAKRLEARMAADCIDAAAFAKMTPVFKIAALTFAAVRRDGLDPAYAIDGVLAGVAHSSGRPVVSLETPATQMRALQMPSTEAIAFVDDSLAELESGRAQPLLVRLANVWRDGDFAELSRYEEWCDCLHNASERAQMKRFLDDRNPAMAASIDTLHTSGKQVFAAVGSLHMIGANGLPALMRQRGYQVDEVALGR